MTAIMEIDEYLKQLQELQEYKEMLRKFLLK